MENDLMVILAPNDEVSEVSGEIKNERSGYCSFIGKKTEQEDAVVLHILPTETNLVSKFTAKEIGENLNESLAKLDKAAPESKKNTEDEKFIVGSTVSSTIWTGEQLITATLGDSLAFAAVYGNDNKFLGVTRLNSQIQSPNNEKEKKRITDLNTKDVDFESPGKVYFKKLRTGIGVTGSIGVHPLKDLDSPNKSIITSKAVIDIYNLNEVCWNVLQKNYTNDLTVRIIIASDGLTERTKPKEKSKDASKTEPDEPKEKIIDASKKDNEDYLRSMLENIKVINEQTLAKELANKAIDNGSGDNVSVAVMTLDSKKPFLGCVFDGHGGKEVSDYLAQQFCPTFYATCFIEAVKKKFNDPPISPKVLTVINKSIDILTPPNNLNNEQFQISLNEKKAIFLSELDKLNWKLPELLKDILDIFFSCAGYQTFKARYEEISKVKLEIEKLHEIVQQHRQDSPQKVDEDEEGKEDLFIEAPK